MRAGSEDPPDTAVGTSQVEYRFLVRDDYYEVVSITGGSQTPRGSTFISLDSQKRN